MVTGFTRLPCPAFCQDYIIVGFIEVPRVIAVAPCTTAYETVAYAVVHLAGESVGVTASVVCVAVQVGVAVDDIVVGAGSLVRKSINIKGIYSGNPAILKVKAKG